MVDEKYEKMKLTANSIGTKSVILGGMLDTGIKFDDKDYDNLLKAHDCIDKIIYKYLGSDVLNEG